jgi:hypothetical protein
MSTGAFRLLRGTRRTTMPKKHGLKSEFVMFDVLYEDGTRCSNRKVPRTLLGGLDGDAPARGFIIEQDREIAAKRGFQPAPIRDLCRSGAKTKERSARGFG